MERGSERSARSSYVCFGPAEVVPSFRGNLGSAETQEPTNCHREVGVIGPPHKVQIEVNSFSISQ